MGGQRLPAAPRAATFPGRADVPKALMFAKDDSYAEDIVRIAREELGKGSEFAQKIAYRDLGAPPEVAGEETP